MEPFEYSKNPFVLVCRNANAVIFDPETDEARLVVGPEANAWLDIRRNKLERVAQEIGQNLCQCEFVRQDCWQSFDRFNLGMALFDLYGALEKRALPSLLQFDRPK